MERHDVPVRIRPAGPSDIRGIGDLGGELSPQSLRRRFMAAVSPDSAIKEFQREVVSSEGQALIAEDLEGRIIGEAYAAPDDAHPDHIEMAFVVGDRAQGHGVGTKLLAALVEQLRRSGVAHAYCDTLLENHQMLEVLRRAELPSKEEFRGAGVIRVVFDLH
jgi:GNAT superfamily N-acetyltransferase